MEELKPWRMRPGQADWSFSYGACDTFKKPKKG
jgi:hypothetical protein